MKRIVNFRIAPLILLSIILAVCTITFCSDSLIIVAVMLAVIALLSVVFIKKLKKARPKLLICILTFFIFLGLTALSYADIENKEIYAQNSIIEADVDMLTACNENGEVASDDIKQTYVRIYLENITVDKRKINGKASAVFIRGTFAENLKIGDRIKFRGDIAPLNFIATDSYSMSNYRNGVFHNIVCDSTPDDDDYLFVKVATGASFGDRIKLRVKKAIYSNTRQDTAGFLFAMTFGDKSGLDSEIKASFSDTGTAHVFAVSGLHVGMLAGALIWLFKLTRLKSRIARISILSTLLLIFCALCDFSPSTVRASVMTIIAVVAKAVGMRNDSLSSMSLSACLILLFKPLYLFEMGFLMSFMAVVGILMLYKPIHKLLRRLPKKISSLLATSIAVNLALLPIMMNYFDGETLFFIIANLLLLPILGIFFPLYIILAFISAIMPFMGWSLTVIAAPFTLLIKLINLISGLPTFIVSFHAETAIIILGIIAAVTLSQYVFASKKFKRITALVMCIALVFTMSTSLRLWGSGNAYVHCYVDKYGCQYLLIDNAYGGNYLVVNDKVSSDTLDAALHVMDEHKFSHIDGIIVVGEADETQIAKLRLNTSCPDIFVYESTENFDGVVVSGNYVIERGFTAAYLSRGCLEITLGERTIRVLADGYFITEGDYDVLISYSPIAANADGKYIVCESGYKNSLENYVSGTFTFTINNDKIKVSRFWRY